MTLSTRTIEWDNDRVKNRLNAWSARLTTSGRARAHADVHLLCRVRLVVVIHPEDRAITRHARALDRSQVTAGLDLPMVQPRLLPGVARGGGGSISSTEMDGHCPCFEPMVSVASTTHRAPLRAPGVRAAAGAPRWPHEKRRNNRHGNDKARRRARSTKRHDGAPDVSSVRAERAPLKARGETVARPHQSGAARTLVVTPLAASADSNEAAEPRAHRAAVFVRLEQLPRRAGAVIVVASTRVDAR